MTRANENRSISDLISAGCCSTTSFPRSLTRCCGRALQIHTVDGRLQKQKPLYYVRMQVKQWGISTWPYLHMTQLRPVLSSIVSMANRSSKIF